MQEWLDREVLRERSWWQRRWRGQPTAALFPQNPAEFDAELQNTSGALKHDRTTTVQQISRGAERFILKRYNARNFWHRIKRALRRSRAERCWDMSEEFVHAGLQVAEPIVMLERRFGPFHQEAFLVTRYLDGAELLQELPIMSASEQSAVVAAVKSAFAALRSHQLSHGDMKASNLLWVEGALFFIDLDAARKHRWHFLWRNAHRKDKKRFLKNWRDAPQLKALFEGL